MKNKNEWELPTEEELYKMYKNLHKKGIGNFANDNYWSSSDDNSDIAWTQYFTNGNQYNYSKSRTFRVRLVKTFETTYTNHYEIGQELAEGFIFDIVENILFICKS